MKRIVSKNPLFFAFLFPASVDAIVTLVGQDRAYWTERVVNEASPAYYFLLASPWLFLIGSIIWLSFWYLLFKRLKEPVTMFLMFLFIAGHSWGSSTWIWSMMRLNGIYIVSNQTSVVFAWGIIVVYFALIAAWATFCTRVYLKAK